MITNLKNRIFKKKEKQKESVLDFICTIVSCWAMTVAAALIQDSQFTNQIGLIPILWQTLVAVVAVALLTRRWWISIIYFGILVPLFFLAVSFSGDILSFFESFGGFIKWWVGGMKIGSKWYSAEGFYLVHTIINIGLSLLFFTVARVTKRAWTTVLTAVILIFINYAWGYTGYNILAVPFYIIGIFPLIAGDKFQNIKLPNVKNLFGVLGKKWMVMMISTIVAVAISLLSLVVIDSTQGSVRNRFCSDIVADFQTSANVYPKEQSSLNITLFDLGLVMNSTYIGGDLYDIKPKTIAKTNLVQQSLIKMTSYETFNGMNWVTNFDKDYRFNGPWEDEQDAFISTRLKDNESFMLQLENIGFRVNVEFSMAKKTNFLPTIGKVMDIEEKTSTINPILFDRQGRLLSQYTMPKDYTYSIDTIIFNTTDEVSLIQMGRILNDYAFETDPLYNKSTDFYKVYTQSLGESKYVANALKRLNFTKENEYEKAYAICQYFSEKNGFSYTDKPPTFKKGDNIITKLFETKKGHCMYYATAMIAMTREAGIPSRLAAGYLTIPSRDKVTQDVDASSPYAWVECYLPNVGWVSFNPTPEQTSRPLNSGGGGDSDGGDSPNITVDDLHEKEEQTVAGTHLKWDEIANIPLLVSLGLLVLFVLVIIYNTLYSQKYYELKSVRKHYKTTDKQLEFYYFDILRQYRWLGLRCKKYETLKEVTLRATDKLTEENKQKVFVALEIIEAQFYGKQTPTDANVESIYEARKVLENKLKDRNNKVMYVVKRRLLLPIFNVAPKVYRQFKKIKK